MELLNMDDISDEEIIKFCKLACEVCGTPAKDDADAIRQVLKDAQEHRRGDFDGEQILWYESYEWDSEQEEIFDRFLEILDKLEKENDNP